MVIAINLVSSTFVRASAKNIDGLAERRSRAHDVNSHTLRIIRCPFHRGYLVLESVCGPREVRGNSRVPAACSVSGYNRGSMSPLLVRLVH